MGWPSVSDSQRRLSARRPLGYTLVEILVATALSLILLGAVVRMFGDVGQSITDSRSMLESADRLRLVQIRLQQDLVGITVPMNVNPPHKPENNEGYFEYIEGPVGTTAKTAVTYTAMTAPSAVAVNTDNGNVGDTTVGDFDDILMFTTRSTGRPFVGKVPTSVNASGTIQSDVAEVAWFVRGRNLHRRVLLVAPSVTMPTATTNFYTNYDISARWDGAKLVANTLGDLTRRECRYAHNNPGATGTFPWNITTYWYWTTGTPTLTLPTLPTLAECTNTGWLPAVGYNTVTTLDFWSNDTVGKRLTDQDFAAGSSRVADDVILTNVIGFDVKAWDPTYVDPTTGLQGAYVDLGYNNLAYSTANYNNNNALASGLSHLGHPRSGLNGSATSARVYDTYSFHYECDGVRQSTAPSITGTVVDAATNGFDDNGNGVVDDIVYNGDPDGTSANSGENETAPPYPIPLRGIQVKIRVFEPDSRQVREVTVVQDFLQQ